MKHYSEAELLETYYTQPGDSMPVMMHLADCSECASRYERLEKKVRGLASCEHDKPETFWARQRISIMRKIDAEGRRSSTFARSARIAAAAALVVVLGSVVMWRENRETPVTQTVAAAVPQVTTEAPPSQDPWQSDELKDYQSMVAWESWVESDSKNGDQSL